MFLFFFQAEDGIRDYKVTGVQTCALPISGHVDLDNEGLEGTAANDRWLSDERLAEVFPKSEAIAKLMDRTGYDTFWLAEHHFQREGYECIPNILMLALHLCHITKNIRIGCGFN